MPTVKAKDMQHRRRAVVDDLTMARVIITIIIIRVFFFILSPSSHAFSRPQRLDLKVKGLSSHSQSQASITMELNWQSLSPSNFHQVISGDGRQYAKDDSYMYAVLDLWKSEGGNVPIQSSPFVYSSSSSEDDTLLYGHLLKRRSTTKSPSIVPGIFLFHTAAGPQDVFLFYKAAVLLQTFDCVVIICDILSDGDGWAWSPDRSQYNHVRASLIEDNGRRLKSRVSAAVRALCTFHNEDDFRVDPQRLAAMGWCLGGQPVMELGQVEYSLTTSSIVPNPSIRAIITFHGVFHRGNYATEVLSTSNNNNDDDVSKEVLICNGVHDPFVSKEDVLEAKKLFSNQGFAVNVLELQGAKHGFSNPAQGLNESPAFDYSETAATESWDATMKLLQRTLFLQD
jgi:dienelactone hydrolase